MKSDTVFLLVRALLYDQWRPVGDCVSLSDKCTGDADGRHRSYPVAAFPTRAAAQSEADRLDDLAREAMNPAWLLHATEFLAADERAVPAATPTGGFPSPVEAKPREDRYSWFRRLAVWYEEQCPTFTPEVRAAVWRRLLGPYRFYSVVEIPFDDTPD